MTETLHGRLAKLAAETPDQIALITDAERLSLGILAARIERAAVGLWDVGLRPGQRVALLLGNGASYVIALFATLRTGAAVVPIDPNLRGNTLAAALASADVSHAVAAARAPRHHPIEALLDAASERLATIICVGDESESPEGTIAWSQVVEAGSDRPPPSSWNDDDVAAIFFTSGTSGSPAGVLHTHKSLLAGPAVLGRLTERMLTEMAPEAIAELAAALTSYVKMSLVPLWTISGHNQLVQTLFSGQALVITEDFRPRRILEIIERERVSNLIAVPSMMEFLLRVPGGDRFDTSSLEIIGLGGSVVSARLRERLAARFGCRVVVGYGSTETGGPVTTTNLSDSADRQLTTVGRVVPGGEIRVVDDNGDPLPPQEIGELVCRIDVGMMNGRLDGDGRGSDGWYHTGDLAAVDEEGYVYLVGRRDDRMTRGASKVYPAEIEAILELHESVKAVAVVGVAHHAAEDRIIAFVECDSLHPRTLRRHCAEHLEPLKVPDVFVKLDCIPLTSTGKAHRGVLRKWASDLGDASCGETV